jgi:hypothetical protein
MKIRTDRTFRIVLYEDYSRLVKHLKHEAEYVQMRIKGYDEAITALKHNGFFFIPCVDEALTNCYYDPERIKKH